jgi:Na+(H+)/acetate symporter ActP
VWSRARTTGEFYVADKHVHPVANGMATAADWMSAASFISMAGLISFLGVRRLRLPDGLDRRLRPARAAAG